MANAEAIKYQVNIPGVDPRDIIRIEGPKSKWVRLVCHLKEVEKDAQGNKIVVERDTINTLFNCKTEKLYNADSKTDLAMKFTALSFGAPIALIVSKTIYHLLFPLSLSYQIYRVVRVAKKQKDAALDKGQEKPKINLASRITKVVIRNFIDIVKTPLYGIAMTITALSTLILSGVNDNILYEGRALYGEMLMSLNWGNKDTLWSIGACMQPYANLKNKNEKKYHYIAKDIEYDAPPGEKMHALNNMARNVHYWKMPDFLK